MLDRRPLGGGSLLSRCFFYQATSEDEGRLFEKMESYFFQVTDIDGTLL